MCRRYPGTYPHDQALKRWLSSSQDATRAAVRVLIVREQSNYVRLTESMQVPLRRLARHRSESQAEPGVQVSSVIVQTFVHVSVAVASARVLKLVSASCRLGLR